MKNGCLKKKCILVEIVKHITFFYSPLPFLFVDLSIRELLRTYHHIFPKENITPKLHLLEDHAVSQLGKFGVGFGLLNEQGGELIHSEFNRIARVVQGMKGDLQKLTAIMKRHHTSTTPEVCKNMGKKSSDNEQ